MTFLFYSLKQHALLTSNLVITNMHLRLKTQKGGDRDGRPLPIIDLSDKGTAPLSHLAAIFGSPLSKPRPQPSSVSASRARGR